MSRKTFFEQIPVEMVKKICQESIKRGTDLAGREEEGVQQPMNEAEFPNRDQSLAPR